MKKNILLFLLLLAFMLPAIAHDFEVGGIYYNISGTEATVTYRGTDYTQYDEYTGDVTIPAAVNYGGSTYSVTSIDKHAFWRCSGLTSVTIPNSVTTISDWAFYSCSGLTSITIGNSVTSIGEYAFWFCSGLTSVTIPNSVTTISDAAFIGCSGLTSVTIGNSVTSIGSGAFAGCGLTSINIPNSVKVIGNNAFLECSSLTRIQVETGNPNYDSRNNCNAIIETASNTLILGCMSTVIPNTVSTIGDDAFEYCTGLSSVTIPNSVTCIGGGAFHNCTGLTGITIPNSVTIISGNVFSGCQNLTSIQVENGNPTYDSRNNCNAIIETSSNKLIAGCMNTIIPNTVTSIGNSAFRGCSGLTSITIGNSVTSIDGYAFYYCRGLTSVDIPNSVASIGGAAFGYCSGLTKIYCWRFIPPTIESNTFNGCYGATLYVPNGAVNAYKGHYYWQNFRFIVGIGSVLPGSTFVVDGIYYRVTDSNVVSVIANEGVDAYYTGNVVIPDSVTYEEETFAVIRVEKNAFDGCYDLISVVIPNSVESIGEKAFQGCTGLKSVTIGSGVTAIGAKAFNYCNAFETIKCIGTVPPVMASSDCFSTAAYNRATLIVPRNYEATYGAADYWYKFAHIDGWGSAGRGDVNGDGVMSIRDVVTLIDVLLGNEIDSFYFESADLNSNGRIDIGDVASIIDGLLNGF